MKVIHLSTTDTYGGAAKGSYRLHEELIKLGVDSKMFVSLKFSKDKSVRAVHWFPIGVARVLLDKLRHGFMPNFSMNWVPSNIHKIIEKENPDVVHIHWVNGGFMSIADIGLIKKPIVWTLRDMWPFSSGYHYVDDPEMVDSKHSFWVWSQKQTHWKDLNVTLAPLSSWMEIQARKSSLFAHYPSRVMLNGQNNTIFSPKPVSKSDLHLPDKKIVLYGALNAVSDERKGYAYLADAMRLLGNGYHLVVFGSREGPYPGTYLGTLQNQEELARYYSVADVMVVPSIYEAFGKTASEALACATPVVAFEETGVADIVQHKKTGYLAKFKDVKDLAQGIKWVCSKDLRKVARKDALERFDMHHISKNYIKLYKEAKR